jgi:hypothetical protein
VPKLTFAEDRMQYAALVAAAAVGLELAPAWSRIRILRPLPFAAGLIVLALVSLVAVRDAAFFETLEIARLEHVRDFRIYVKRQ